MQLKSIMGSLVSLFLFASTVLAFPPAQGIAEKVVDYTPGVETPEAVATDYYGNVYMSLLLTGEIVKVDPYTGDSEPYAQFDLSYNLCALNQIPGIAGIWVHPFTRVIYANVNTCDPSTKGVYKVPADGSDPVLLATVPMSAMLNGIVKRGTKLYSTDSFSITGEIYSTSIYGDGSPAGILIEDPLLAFDPFLPPPDGIPFMPGANGIQKYNGDLYVGHSGNNIIVKIPMSGYGPWTQVGAPVVHVEAKGVDDFAFDWAGNIYFTNDPYNQLVMVNPQNQDDPEILMTEEDGINGSTAAAFGRFMDRKVLFVTSAAFPFMPPPFNNGQAPSLIAWGNDIGGYPFR